MFITRDAIGTMKANGDHSLAYWLKEAKGIFERHPEIHTIEIVRGGKKTDSTVLKRGQKHTPPGVWVVIASTTGRWGRSRGDYIPALNK